MRKGLAVLALVAIVVVGACGDDDSDETDADGGATDSTAQDDTNDTADETDGSDETSQAEASVGEGYTDPIRSNFMTACAAQAGATEAQCECTFDEIATAVPIEQFTAYDQAVRQDPATPPPSWLTAAVTACS